MTKKELKPIVKEYSENEWEFIFPHSIDNEKVNDEFWNGVELLNYDDKKAEQIFKQLIFKHEYYIDAYNHLSIAYSNQNKIFESLLTAEKAYTIGKACFTKEFDFKKDKLIWSCLDNRPFLRACQIYGLELQKNKQFEKAIELFTLNLTLNENDNQGIRYLLLEIYFSTKDLKQARKLINKYSDDYSIEFNFGNVVLNILEGREEIANKLLDNAIKINKYFINEVVKEKHIKPEPFRIPNEPHFDAGIPIGTIQQAFDYWSRNKELYKKKEIIDYFKKKKTSH